jgi:hypothetical protein
LALKTIRIGSGAGYSGDRIEPAVELAEKGDIKYLVFECLAERTIAIAQQNKLRDPAKGFDPLLSERMRAVLKTCVDKHIRIVTNMGAANPLGAARKVHDIANALGISRLKIGVVAGDDVIETLKGGDYRIEETGERVSDVADKIISANAYLGCASIVEALRTGADVVITGRVADPALFLAPLVHEFGWADGDWQMLGRGTLVGHLLECAGQVTGGYFADPGIKDVPDLARLGFPIAEVGEDGTCVITKVPGSGGAVTASTCKEQVLYEIHDPASYFTPDVIADFSAVRVREIGSDRVSVSGAGGRQRPDNLKISVGYDDGYVGEGQISYAGPNALARAELAAGIVRERLRLARVETSELRLDLIGRDSVYGRPLGSSGDAPGEVRLRVAGRCASARMAGRIGNEVEALYTNGPAGGGGATKSVRHVIAMYSAFLPRHEVRPAVQYFEV